MQKKKKKILKDVEINNFRFVKSEVSGFIILQKDWIFFFFFSLCTKPISHRNFYGEKKLGGDFCIQQFILFLINLHPFQAFEMNTKVIASEVKSDPLSLGSRLYQQETQSSCFRTKQKKD